MPVFRLALAAAATAALASAAADGQTGPELGGGAPQFPEHPAKSGDGGHPHPGGKPPSFLEVPSDFTMPDDWELPNITDARLCGCGMPPHTGGKPPAGGEKPPNQPGNGGQPGGMPGGKPGGMPGGMPGGKPGGKPGGMPGGIPGGKPGGMPGGTPGGMPGGMPGGTPGGMPGGMPSFPGGIPSFPDGIPSFPDGMPSFPGGMSGPGGMPGPCACPPKTMLPPGMAADANPATIVQRMSMWDKPRPMRDLPEGCPSWVQTPDAIEEAVVTKVDALKGKDTAEFLKLFAATLGEGMPDAVVKAVYSAKDKLTSEAGKAMAEKLLGFAMRVVAMDQLQQEITTDNATECVRQKPKRGHGQPRRFRATLKAGMTIDGLKEKLANSTGLAKENIEVTEIAARRAEASKTVSVEFKGKDAGYASSVIDYMSDDEQAALGLSAVSSEEAPKTGAAGPSDSSVSSLPFAVLASAAAAAAVLML